jgi:glycerophosphoryl diester phosphodiesterase
MKFPILDIISPLAPLILGHRGSRIKAAYPENTLSSFQEAYELGAQGIELDLRLMADNEILVYHDRNLLRHFDSPQKISRSSSIEIKHYAFYHEPENRKIAIPLLREVFEKFGSQFIYNLEIKPAIRTYRSLLDNLINLIQEFKLQDHVWVSSFDPYFLWLWNRRRTNIPGGYLFGKLSSKACWVCRQAFIQLLHPHVSLVTNQGLLLNFNKNLCFWTVNDYQEYLEIEKFGPLAIISDNIPLLMKKKSGRKPDFS